MDRVLSLLNSRGEKTNKQTRKANHRVDEGRVKRN